MRGQAIRLRAQAQKEKHPFQVPAPIYHITTGYSSRQLTTLLLLPAFSSLNAYDTGLQQTRSLESAVGPSLPFSLIEFLQLFLQVLTPSSSLFSPLRPPRHLAIKARPRTASFWLKLAEKVEEVLTGTHHRRTSAASSAISPGRDSDLHRISVRIDAPLRPVHCPFSASRLPMACNR